MTEMKNKGDNNMTAYTTSLNNPKVVKILEARNKKSKMSTKLVDPTRPQTEYVRVAKIEDWKCCEGD